MTYNIGETVNTNMPYTDLVVKITYIQKGFDGSISYYKGTVVKLPERLKQTARKKNRIYVGTTVNFLPTSVKGIVS